MNKYKFDCGCEFEITDDNIKENDGLPGIKIDYENIPEDCPATWDLIHSGHTKGVFQLETNLGRKWAKDLAPSNITEMSALISLMRPGCISGETKILVNMHPKNNHRNGKYVSMKELYNKRMNITQIMSYNEETGEFFRNNVKEIVHTGRRAVYRVKLSKSCRRELIDVHTRNYDLVCTNDHKLLTDEGWVELKNMQIGDRFAILNWKSNRQLRNQKNIPGQKSFRQICFNHYKYKCVFCDWGEGSLDVNHLDVNRRTNNNSENLCFMCPNHHRMYSEHNISKSDVIEARKQHTLPQSSDIMWAEFNGLEYLGTHDVYDICMEGPHHNFVAGKTVVHNCLRSLIDGKSMTEHYCDRKSHKEEVSYFHEALEPILKETYGTLVYQEETIRISQDIAGFNLQEADTLRKSTGKKDAKLMSKVKGYFIDGCEKTGIVSKEEAEEIFGWIQESQRYSFNKCLDPNTNVETKDGFKTISTLSIGEYIKAPGDKFVEVTDKIDSVGKRMLYRVKLESGKFIDCSIEHKFLCEDYKVRPLWKIIKKNHSLRSSKIDYVKLLGLRDTIDITVRSEEHLFYANGIATSNSHGVSYGLMGYWAAYIKTHFPLHFYAAWLYYAHARIDPQEEMQLLISDARYFEIDVKPPSLKHLFQGDIGHFALYDDCVFFGVGDVKGIGQSLVDKITQNVKVVEDKLGRTINNWSWSDFLIHFSDMISTTAVNGMIAAGATDYMGKNRTEKIHEYCSWKQLTQKERDWIKTNYSTSSIISGIESMLNNKPRLSKPRKKKVTDVLDQLKTPPFSVKDTSYYIAQKEAELLGVPITQTKLDTCKSNITPDTTCKEFLQGKSGKMSIAVEITDSNEYIIKKGKMKGSKMMFLTVQDLTGSLDSVVVFPRILEGNRPFLIKGGTVLLTGKRDQQRNESFIVDEITQI